MAVKIINIELSKIKQEPFNRFDVKFYLVNHFFDKLSTQHNFKVESLNNLKENIISGSYIDSYTTKEEGIPYLRVGDIKPFCFDENEDDLVYVSKYVPEKIKIKTNDILVARTQATIDKLGTASIADKAIEGWATSQHTTRVIVNPKKISPFYIVAYLNSRFFKAQTALASHGDTRVEMTHSQLSQVRIFIPEIKLLENIIEKVKKVVTYNREAQELIESAKAEFLNIVKLKTKVTKEKSFSGDLKTLTEFDIWNPTCHLPFYVENERKLKQSFKTLPLGQVADIKKGSEAGSDNYEIYLWRKETDYAFIRTSDIINNEIDLFPDYFIPTEIVSSFNQDLRTGDILFTKDGKIGQTAMVTENDKALIASGVSRIRIKSEIVKQHKFTQEYLFICLSVKQTGYYPAIRRTVIGTTIPHLREERMKQISIPILKEEHIKSITEKIKKAFKLKSDRKEMINNVLQLLDREYNKLAENV